MSGGQPIFGNLAAGYALGRPAVHPLVIDRIRGHLQLGSSRKFGRALDVGCGAGLSTRPLDQLADRTFGVDVAESMVGRALGVAPAARFLVGRAEDLPIRSGSIGLVTAAGSLNYAKLDRFFPEAARVLEPGGALVVYDFSPGRSFPESESLDEWFAGFLERYPWPPGEALELSPERLSQLTSLFRVDSYEDFEIGLPLSPEFYVDYVLTETNVSYAKRNGEALEDIRKWCEETLSRVFGGKNREVLFRGYIAYLAVAGHLRKQSCA